MADAPPLATKLGCEPCPECGLDLRLLDLSEHRVLYRCEGGHAWASLGLLRCDALDERPDHVDELDIAEEPQADESDSLRGAGLVLFCEGSLTDATARERCPSCGSQAGEPPARPTCLWPQHWRGGAR